MQQERHAHHLKTWPQYFILVKNGHKTFEVRKRDRDFKITDAVLLQEWDPVKKEYTGQEVAARITYILEEFEGLRPGYCAMSIKPVDYYLPGDVVRVPAKATSDLFVVLNGSSTVNPSKVYEIQNIETGAREIVMYSDIFIA